MEAVQAILKPGERALVDPAGVADTIVLPAPELKMQPLRLAPLPFERQNEAQWIRSSPHHQTIWDEVTMLRKAVAELQEAMTEFIDLRNGCKDCP